MPTTEITLRGLRLEVEFEAVRVFDTWAVRANEIRMCGHEILCILDDMSIRAAERQIEAQIQEGKCHT